MGQWRQKFVAIRHSKSGDFGKFAESYQKVAIFGQKNGDFDGLFQFKFVLSNFPKLRLNLQKLATLCKNLNSFDSFIWQISARYQ